MKLKRLQFTLIEMLIVLSIIALVAGVIGINAKKALRDQHFKSELSAFLDRLRLAQDLMLIADADVHFKIEANESEKAIKYWIETDQTFSKQFDRMIKKVGVLKTIHHVSHASGKDGLIDLKFLSKGSVISSGTIQLSSVIKNNRASALIAYIPLKGYPGPIHTSHDKEKEDSPDILNKDMQLIQSTIQEIQAIEYEKNN